MAIKKLGVVLSGGGLKKYNHFRLGATFKNNLVLFSYREPIVKIIEVRKELW